MTRSGNTPDSDRQDSAGRDEAPDGEPLRFGELLQSVLAALIGVQSESARRRDFGKGRPLHFIIIGVAATIVCVLIIAGIVKLALAAAGV